MEVELRYHSKKMENPPKILFVYLYVIKSCSFLSFVSNGFPKKIVFVG